MFFFCIFLLLLLLLLLFTGEPAVNRQPGFRRKTRRAERREKRIVYRKQFEENGAKKQREEATEIDKSKTRHDKLNPDGATPKRDGRM